MNKTITLVLWFTRLKLTDLIAVAHDVMAKMSGNPAFPTPNPPLSDIKAATDEAETAMQEASSGDRVKIAVRNEKEAVLMGGLRNPAAYVQGNCDNNEANVLSAGFRVRKSRTPVGMLPAPTNVRLGYTGMSGEFLLRLAAVPNKLNYTIQMAEAPDGPYETIATSSSGRKVLSGFTPGKTYWMRVCANGTSGPGPYSVPVSAMAL